MNNKVIILGSCVSRDIFNYKTELILEDYFSRTTLRSLFGEKYPIGMEDIICDRQYTRKCIYRDFNSSFLDCNFDNKTILLDFIDERFKLISINNNIVGTESSEYIKSNLPINLSGIQIIKNDIEGWKEACSKFIIFLKNTKNVKVILHKSLYKEYYLDEYENIVKFDKEIQTINSYNIRLNQMYEFIQKEFDEIYTVEYIENKYKASSKNRWGLAPFHYEDDYYLDILKQIENIISFH